jgi:hypothetical protein
MDIIEWFFTESIIRREFYNGFYFVMFIITVISIILMWRTKLIKFSLLLWFVSGFINILWEGSLYLGGSRQYTFGGAELLYHALTEAGPGLIIMVVTAEKLKLINIKHLHDGEWKWRLPIG